MSLYRPGNAVRSLSVEDEPSPDVRSVSLDNEPSAAPTLAIDENERIRVLMTNFHSMVWRTVHNLGVAEAEVDDAVQQVFIIAFNKLDRIHTGRERAFLAGVAVRVASRYRRTCARRREAVERDSVEQPATSGCPVAELDRAEARKIFEQLLDTMPSDLRLVFVMYEVEELTLSEIATALDLPLGTVASRVRRARQQFVTRARRINSGLGTAGQE